LPQHHVPDTCHEDSELTTGSAHEANCTR